MLVFSVPIGSYLTTPFFLPPWLNIITFVWIFFIFAYLFAVQRQNAQFKIIVSSLALFFSFTTFSNIRWFMSIHTILWTCYSSMVLWYHLILFCFLLFSLFSIPLRCILSSDWFFGLHLFSNIFTTFNICMTLPLIYLYHFFKILTLLSNNNIFQTDITTMWFSIFNFQFIFQRLILQSYTFTLHFSQLNKCLWYE